MGLFRRRPRFSVSVQIEELVLEECGGRVVRGDGKDPHEFEQLVLKVSGRRSLSSRNKKIAFRLSARDRDFRKQQSLPFRERFPFQGKLQRRWRRQKPQLIRFRLYGLPRKTKLAPTKKVLLAEFSLDLTQHLNRLFELDAPPQTSTVAITTPGGPVQPPILSARPFAASDQSRVLALRMFATDDSLCIGSHLVVLLDSIHIVKRESSTRRINAASNASDRRRRRDAQPHRQVEMVRTAPLMYRLQNVGGSVVSSSLALPLGDTHINSTDSDCSSDSSASSSSDDGGVKPKARASRRTKRLVRRTSTAMRVSSTLLGTDSENQDDCRDSSHFVDKAPARRRFAAPSLLELNAAENRRAEPTSDDGDEMEEMKPSRPAVSSNNSDNHETNGTHSSMEALYWRPRKLSSIPDDGEEEEKNDNDDNTSCCDGRDRDDSHLHHDEGDNDADDEDDRRSYSFVQGELDHRDAVIAALRAENRAQAGLIAQLQTENRRLRAEAACRGPANPLIASMSSTALSTTPEAARKLGQRRSVTAERESATDSELQVAKRSASVPFMAPPGVRATSTMTATTTNNMAMTAARRRRASVGRPRTSDGQVLPEEQVFEGLVQEIQEEFRCLLPARGGAISSA